VTPHHCPTCGQFVSPFKTPEFPLRPIHADGYVHVAQRTADLIYGRQENPEYVRLEKALAKRKKNP
jgi:hypothetical protein